MDSALTPAGIGRRRPTRVRPVFMPWALNLTGEFKEDAGITFDEFVLVVQLAGVVEGIGDRRECGYGRFKAIVHEQK